jgi:hypothetical protein
MKTKRTTQLTLLLAALFLLCNAALKAQAAPISFAINNVECYVPGPPACTPWMFDLDSPEYLTSDGNPFSYVDDPFYGYHNFAYRDFYSTSAANPPWDERFPYSAACTQENLNFVDGTAGFSINFDDYALTAFQHVNTINPGAAWNILGQAGDRRTYTNGTSTIFHNGIPVLQVNNCVLDVLVHYPNAAQIRESTGINAWTTNVGSGLGSEVSGWGIVDVANSDPDWVAVFADPNVGNRVKFDMSSVSNVIQHRYGYYSFDLDLVVADHDVQQVQDQVLFPGALDFVQLDVDFDFHTVDLGGPNSDLGDLIIFLIDAGPEGVFPEEIQSLHPRYWNFGTTLGSFETDVTFNLEDFGDSSFWQVLRRGDGENSWQIWHDITILDENRIRANNVNAFSEWAVGSTEDSTLPVILSSFTAIYTNHGDVKISWTTQSESQLAGYRIFKAQSTDLSAAMQISDLIEGTNSSQLHSYQFTDADVVTGNSYNYWLQQAEMNGEHYYHGPISVHIDQQGEQSTPDLDIVSAIRRVFPNPASSPTIDIALAKDARLNISVYNARGQKVKSLFSGYKSKGIHYIIWDGKDNQQQLCPSGIYFIELKVDHQILQRSKFMLFK